MAPRRWDGDLLPPRIRLGFPQWSDHTGAARTVHEQVHRAERLLDLFDGRCDLGRVGHVRDHWQGPMPQLRGGLLESGRGAGHESHLVLGSDQSPSHAEPEVRARALTHRAS
jgi:hypothetical protein